MRDSYGLPTPVPEAEDLPTCLWRVTDAGIILESLDDAARRTPFGSLAAGAIGDSAASVCAMSPDVVEDLARCARERKTFRRRREWTVQSTGEQRSLDLTYTFVPPDTIVMCGHDIVARQRTEGGWQAEAALLEAELATTASRLARVIGNAPLLLWTVDTDGVVTLSEGAGLAALGLRPGEAVGQKTREQSGDVEPGRELMERALGGEACSGLLEARGLMLDVHYFPERDAQSRVVGATGIAVDVTARTQAEQERRHLQDQMRRSAEEWKATFDAVESPLLMVDSQGRVKRLNRAALDLWGARGFREVIGRFLWDRPGEPWTEIAHAADRAQGARASVASSVLDQAGRTWDIAASSFDLADAERGVTILARDASPLVALQQSLRRSETMSAMGALLSGVAHEVRNPLFGISAAIDAFESEFTDREDYRQYSSLLRNEVARLNTLMSDLLEYGRPAQTELAPGRLEDVVQRAVRSCALRARECGVDVVTDLAPDLPLVAMEAGRLIQVFQNVVENAVQHAPRGSQVRVSASEAPDGDRLVRCLVIDAGAGFRPEDRARVFEPFFTRRRGGTGLGLSIVQKIVEEHGGTVQVANVPEGGAVVTIDLPAAQDAPRAERA